MITRMLVSSAIVFSLSVQMPVFSNHLSTQTQTTPDSQVERIKLEIDRIGVGEIVTVFHIRGKIFIGRITRIGDTDFDISDTNVGTPFTLRYSEVKKVEKEIYLGFKKVRTAGDRSTPITFDSHAAGVKLMIENLGIGELITISHINGRKFRGLITRIGDADFDISDFNRQTTFTIQYGEVKKIDNGRRSDRTWWIVGIASLAAIPLIYLAVRPKTPDIPRFPN